MLIHVTCRWCRWSLAAGDNQIGEPVKCPVCDRVTKLPGPLLRFFVGQPPPAAAGLKGVLGLTQVDWTVEHLRVIRLYIGWLLILAAAPLAVGVLYGVWIAVAYMVAHS
jgi:hypothetical protein